MRLLLVTALLLALVASAAHADEVFVLDNGEVLRGWVVRETEGNVQIRLTGYMREATVRLPVARIVRRYGTRAAPTAPTVATTGPVDWAGSAAPPVLEVPQALPAIEPTVQNEGFFHRLARVAVRSVPEDDAGRALFAALLFVALMAVVALGCRVAEIDGPHIGRVTVLAALLGIFLVVDVWQHAEVLRADRAFWILPLQGMAWLGAAMAVLRCGFAYTVLLFAFVLFTLATSVFAAGAILVWF